MRAYYLSRFVVSILFGLVFAFSGSPWWGGLLAGGAAFAWFLIAPHIGRYSVHPEYGVTALRRDERSQGINDKAARNAFIVTMLALGGFILFQGAAASVLKWLIVLGVVTYYASDIWLRRALS